MIIWLDHLIFGNGWGLGSPYCNQVYYWLNDTSKVPARGEFYTYNGWLGAQLHSIQWRSPKPGETRTIAGYKFRAFSVTRRYFRTMVSWEAVDMPGDLGKAHEFLAQLKHAIQTTLR